MFGVSLLELVVIGMVILIALGPEKLPQAARTFGKIMGNLKRHSDALRREFYNTVYTPVEDVKSRIDLSARELISVLTSRPQEELNCEERDRLALAKKEVAEEEQKKAAASTPPESLPGATKDE